MSQRSLIAVTLAFAILALGSVGLAWAAHGWEGVTPPGARSAGDIICGPRCVHHILNRYGRDEDLIDLVREIQWPEIEKGSTLADLETALKKRGIFTAAVKISRKARIQWPHPVLVHLEGEGSDIGHFVVWLSRRSRSISNVWVGLAGEQTVPDWKLARHRSGYVLLTSPVPIGDLRGVFEGG